MAWLVRIGTEGKLRCSNVWKFTHLLVLKNSWFFHWFSVCLFVLLKYVWGSLSPLCVCVCVGICVCLYLCGVLERSRGLEVHHQQLFSGAFQNDMENYLWRLASNTGKSILTSSGLYKNTLPNMSSVPIHCWQMLPVEVRQYDLFILNQVMLDLVGKLICQVINAP